MLAAVLTHMEWGWKLRRKWKGWPRSSMWSWRNGKSTSRRRLKILNKHCQMRRATLISIVHWLKIIYLIGTTTSSLDFDRTFPLFLSHTDTVFTIPCLTAARKDSWYPNENDMRMVWPSTMTDNAGDSLPYLLHKAETKQPFTANTDCSSAPTMYATRTPALLDATNWSDPCTRDCWDMIVGATNRTMYDTLFTQLTSSSGYVTTFVKAKG